MAGRAKSVEELLLGDTSDGEDDDDALFDEVGASYDQCWDNLVEGVADEGVLHGHGRAGLPDPLLEDALLDEVAATATATAAPALALPNASEGSRSSSLDEGGDGLGDDIIGVDGRGQGLSDDGYDSSCDGQQGDLFLNKPPHACLGDRFTGVTTVVVGYG